MNSFHFNFNFECHQQVLSTSKIVEPFLDFFPDTKKKAFKIERFVCYKAPNQNTKYKKYQFCIFDFVTIRSAIFRNNMRRLPLGCFDFSVQKITNKMISLLLRILCSTFFNNSKVH